MIARALAAVFRFYKRILSPALPPACRFHPTCSEYAAEAVLAHGALKGSGLTLARILRCHPWNAGGFDPVPPAASPARPPRA